MEPSEMTFEDVIKESAPCKEPVDEAAIRREQRELEELGRACREVGLRTPEDVQEAWYRLKMATRFPEESARQWLFQTNTQMAGAKQLFEFICRIEREKD